MGVKHIQEVKIFMESIWIYGNGHSWETGYGMRFVSVSERSNASIRIADIISCNNEEKSPHLTWQNVFWLKVR